MRDITIAIDGYSSCGKSTLSRDLANALGYAYIDTGAMYRAVTLYCLQKDIVQECKPVDARKVIKELLNIHIEFKFNPISNTSETYLNGKNVEEEIRSMPVSNIVSTVSAIHEVRAMMVYLQRQMGKSGNMVMDGRDIGTTVFPHAELKLFMTADPEVRVQRRKTELQARGIKVTDAEVRKNIQRRDHDDTNRLESPLTQAPDAIVIDNTNLTREQQLGTALRLAKGKMITE